MEKREDLLPSVLLPECPDFVPQQWLRAWGDRDTRFPREESCLKNTCCRWQHLTTPN